MIQNKAAQDDLAWFDGLSGKTETGQGALLRRELCEIERADARQEDTAHDWQRLQFAMRREQARSGWHVFAMAASALIFFSTVYMFKPISELPKEDAVMRGMAEQVMVSETAAQDAGQLEVELQRLGVKVFRHSTAEKIELHIRLTYPVQDKVRAALETRIIPLPEQGELTVLFIQSAPPAMPK